MNYGRIDPPSIRTEIKSDCITLIVIKLDFCRGPTGCTFLICKCFNTNGNAKPCMEPSHTSSSLFIRGQTIIPSEHSLRANSTMTEERLRAPARSSPVHTMLGVDRRHQHFPSTPLWQTLRRRRGVRPYAAQSRMRQLTQPSTKSADAAPAIIDSVH